MCSLRLHTLESFRVATVGKDKCARDMGSASASRRKLRHRTTTISKHSHTKKPRRKQVVTHSRRRRRRCSRPERPTRAALSVSTRAYEAAAALIGVAVVSVVAPFARLACSRLAAVSTLPNRLWSLLPTSLLDRGMLKDCPQHQWINQRTHETRTAFWQTY